MGCYFCGKEATGVEHIPPRSFFPKGKRENLITVESCDLHNQEKSKEDEYIRAILLSSIKLDGQDHIEKLRDKNNRAVKRCIERAYENNKSLTKDKVKEILDIFDKYKDDPLGAQKAINEISAKDIMHFGLLELLNKDIREEVATGIDGKQVNTSSFIYDRRRFDTFFEWMARGIFFHDLGTRWDGRVNILPHTFLKDNAPKRDKELSHDFLQHFDLELAKGSQKEYFCYEGAKRDHPVTGETECIFYNFCLFNTFYFTAVFPF